MRKRFVIFMISVCVLMFVAAGVHFYDLYQQWSSSEALLGRAAIAVRKNQLSEAEILVRNAIKADPDNVDARLQIANILTAISIERGEKESPAAVEQLIHAARLAPDDVTVQTRVFDSLMRLGRHKAALEYAQKAVDQGSDHVLALWALLAAELKSENWETADRLLNRLEKVSDPGSVTLFAQRLLILEGLGQKSRQEESCTQFLSRFAAVSDLELKGLAPELVLLILQTINQQIDVASTEQLIPRASAGLRIIGRFLDQKILTDDPTPQIQLAQKLVAKAEQANASETTLTRIHVEFTKIGRIVFADDFPMPKKSPE